MEGIGKVEGIIPFPFFDNLSKELLETLGSPLQQEDKSLSSISSFRSRDLVSIRKNSDR